MPRSPLRIQLGLRSVFERDGDGPGRRADWDGSRYRAVPPVRPAGGSARNAVSAPFQPGERVLLIDPQGRRFLVKLGRGISFHFHGGIVPHDLVLDAPEGTVVHSSLGTPLTCLRPRMADFVLKMPPGAQVVYS